MSEQNSILIVDDDRVFRERLAQAFARRGFVVRSAGGHDEALVSVRDTVPDMVVLDLRMGSDRSGLDTLKELKAIGPSIRIIILTGYGSISTTVEAMRLGASNYVAKPADADEILAAFAKGEQPPLTAVDRDDSQMSLAEAEWEMINRAVADAGGNISEAARRLGLHRRTLQRKLAKFRPGRPMTD